MSVAGRLWHTLRTRRDALIADDESVVPTKEDTLAVELAFWEAAKDSGSPVEFKLISSAFPTASLWSWPKLG